MGKRWRRDTGPFRPLGKFACTRRNRWLRCVFRIFPSNPSWLFCTPNSSLYSPPSSLVPTFSSYFRKLSVVQPIDFVSLNRGGGVMGFFRDNELGWERARKNHHAVLPIPQKDSWREIFLFIQDWWDRKITDYGIPGGNFG